MKNYYFDAPVFVKDFVHHSNIKEKILNLIDQNLLSSSDKEDEKLTSTDWYIEQGNQRQYWNYLEPYLIEHMIPLMKQVYIENFSFVNYWYNRYDNTDFRDWHRHQGSNWSSIYYLHMPDSDHATLIKDFHGNIVQLEIQEGQILTMPSIFFHASPVNNSEKKIIAFNIL